MIRKLLGLMLAINLIYVILGVAKYGGQHVDAYGIWMLKAKDMGVLWDERYAYSHQRYPLLLPVMMMGWEKVFGSVESFVWIYPIVYVGVLVVLYRLTTSMLWTTVASFMGPLMAQGGRMHAGLADIWITLLVGLGMLAMRKRRVGWLSVIVIIASQIKMEGIFLLTLFIGIEKSWRDKLPWMGLALIPFGWWQWQVRAWGIESDINLYWPGWFELLGRIRVIIGLIIKEMLNWRNWYVIWPIWWLMPKKRKELLLLGVMSGGYLLVYLLAQIDVKQYVSSSVDRIMLQLLPLWWGSLGRKAQDIRGQ